MKLSSRLATEEKKQFGDVVEQDNGNNATLDRNGGSVKPYLPNRAVIRFSTQI
jgi:ureidoglycolate hydrolase